MSKRNLTTVRTFTIRIHPKNLKVRRNFTSIIQGIKVPKKSKNMMKAGEKKKKNFGETKSQMKSSKKRVDELIPTRILNQMITIENDQPVQTTMIIRALFHSSIRSIMMKRRRI